MSRNVSLQGGITMAMNKNHPCHGCIYLSLVAGEHPCCNYIFMEDKRRPCPPGEGCTVKITSEEVKKQKAEKRRELSVEQMKRKKERDRLRWEEKRASRVRHCRRCGREFHPDQHRKFFCGEECRTEQALDIRRACDIRHEEKRKAARSAAREKKKNESNA